MPSRHYGSGQVGALTRAQLIDAMQFAHQLDAVLSQINPVSGTLYTVLATVTNARIISIFVQCTFTVQPSPLECHITIDGLPKTISFVNPATATPYIVGNTNTATDFFTLSTTAGDAYRAFLMEGKSVQVQVEITGGTVQLLEARVKYARRI